MSNLRILLYVFVLSLAACHPEGTNVKQGLDKAAQLMEQDPDTASVILETIQMNQMNEAQLAEYNLLCTQFNEDKIYLTLLIIRFVRPCLIMSNTEMKFRSQKPIIIWHV